MTSASSTPHWVGPIKLRFEDRLRVAGETIAGHRGHKGVRSGQRARTRLITLQKNYGLGRKTIHRLCPSKLFREKQSLWTPGSVLLEAGSKVLGCPFQFQLPENFKFAPLLSLLFFRSKVPHSGAISYSLEVVAERRGRFRANHQIRRLISVVPAASPDQLLVKEALREGWTGQWRDITQEKKLRQGIWGDYSHSRAILSIVDLPSYPIGTPIPFRLQISTETKLVHRSDTPDKHGKPLLPAPPTQASQLKPVLRRVAEIAVRNKTHHQTDTFALPLTQGLEAVEGQRAESLWDIQAVVDEPQWIPKDKDHGIWKRSVQFNSTLLFPFSPSVSTQTLDWQYELRFVVPFPGTSNNLKIWTPIHHNANSGAPVSTGATGSASLPVSTIHLPPYV
ncbi:hypothetical protein DFH09DRAFT_1286365 [Mycena vulgaris]|nr:hypothetical protein DFH09DRAFT_1286365 [Mycena vulgaris]